MSSCFILADHKILHPGDEGPEEDIHSLIYSYPDSVLNDEANNLIRGCLALSSFITLSLNRSYIRSVSLNKSIIAIKSFQHNDSLNFFLILRLPASFGESVVERNLNDIYRGLVLIFGCPSNWNSSGLHLFMTRHQQQIFRTFFPSSDNEYQFSFPSVEYYSWSYASVVTLLAELYMSNLSDKIWGCVCYSSDKLISSTLPLDFVRLFSFVPFCDNVLFPIFITSDDRKKFTCFSKCSAQIPDTPFISAYLLCVKHKDIVYYILVDPVFDVSLYSSINQLVSQDAELVPIEVPRENVMMFYNSHLHLLVYKDISKDALRSSIFLHDYFLSHPECKEIFIHNSRSFFLSMNVFGIEFYSIIINSDQDDVMDAYQKLVNQNSSFCRTISKFGTTLVLAGDVSA